MRVFIHGSSGSGVPVRVIRKQGRQCWERFFWTPREKEPWDLRLAWVCANRLPEVTRLVWMTNRVTSGWLKSGREDLNLRPHGPEPCALAGLRYAPIPVSLADAIIPQIPHLVKYGLSGCRPRAGSGAGHQSTECPHGKKLPTCALCAILGRTRPHHAASSFTSTDRTFPEIQK